MPDLGPIVFQVFSYGRISRIVGRLHSSLVMKASDKEQPLLYSRIMHNGSTMRASTSKNREEERSFNENYLLLYCFIRLLN